MLNSEKITKVDGLINLDNFAGKRILNCTSSLFLSHRYRNFKTGKTCKNFGVLVTARAMTLGMS
jgi:hypothetical protein